MRAPMLVPPAPNARWSLDFASDVLADGRRFRMLCVVDEFSRQCLGLIADTTLSGAHAQDGELDSELVALLATRDSRTTQDGGCRHGCRGRLPHRVPRPC